MRQILAVIAAAVAAAALTVAPLALAGSNINPGRGSSTSSAGVADLAALQRKWATTYIFDVTNGTFGVIGSGGPTTTSNASIAYANDVATDSARVMLKASVSAIGTNAAWQIQNHTKRAYLPKMTAWVYVPSLGGANGQDRIVRAGFTNSVESTTGTGQICAGQSQTVAGVWICYVNATIAGYCGGGVNWSFVRGDGVSTLCSDSGVPVTVGLHKLTVDFSTSGQVTFSVDGLGVATFSTGLPAAATAIGPFIACGTWATLTAYSCSSPGWQVTQNF